MEDGGARIGISWVSEKYPAHLEAFQFYPVYIMRKEKAQTAKSGAKWRIIKFAFSTAFFRLLCHSFLWPSLIAPGGQAHTQTWVAAAAS